LLTQYKLSAISILIEGVPSNATLSAGRNQGSGIWTLSGDQIKNLTMAVPTEVNQDVQLMIIATAPKPDGDTASSVTTVIVKISAMASVRMK
jgi:hypothetical protein